MKDNEMLRIPMQFFAESAESAPEGEPSVADNAPEGDEGNSKPSENNPAPASDKTFSQADVDRIVAERLERQSKKFAAEKEEAAKLAKMNAEEKAKYASQKREEELTAREKEVQTKELRYTSLGILEEKKLPSKLIDCVDLSSAESSKKSIEAIQTAWTEALTAAVNERLKSNPPAFSGGNKNTDPFFEGFGQ